ncbi:MAG: exopolysaccharide biosynthesis polyprenyl glycosylphosphotransferase [Bacteroidales bacterium]|jgi:exopolysaccharide biosynthesis polyprenyl glycosylphosphotransferase|nr:exopolysaccharide biosynthesis polyprenyl glycosylphosphotransferase [Bacteroidales bacterium]
MDIFSSLVRLKIIPFLKKWNLLNSILGAIDILAITLAFQFSYYINYLSTGGFFFTERNFLFLYLSIMPLWLIVLYFINIAEIPRTKRYRVLFLEYFQSALVIGILLLLVYFMFKMAWISRLFLIEFTILGFVFLLTVRVLEYKVFKIYRAKGYNYVNVVLIADDSSIPFIERLIANPEWGYRIISIFSESVKVKEKYEKTIILLQEEYLAVLHDLMEGDIIDEVLYVKSKVVPSEVRNVIRSCEELGVTFRLKYDDDRLNLTNAIKTNIENEKFLTFINVPYNSYALTVKKIMDITLSLLLIILLSPLLLTISILIKITSKGPLIYKQSRVGLRGRQFDLYKFRTMIINADQLRQELESKNEADGPVFKIKDDPRVTGIGNFLRKTGFDELPQLINVLKGEMSLIGPRPPLKEETKHYKRWQLRRLSVKPGLSCFWQIKPDRNSIKFEKWMEMDLAYIDNWSLRLDFIILIKTIRTVFQRTGL